MALTNQGSKGNGGRDRQYTLNALLSFNTDDLAAPAQTGQAAGTVVFYLPPGAYLLGGNLSVKTAFNGTTPTLTAKDNSASPVSLFGTVAGTVGNTALAAGLATYYPAGATIVVAAGGTGVTTGEALVHVQYIVLGRGNEVYTG